MAPQNLNPRSLTFDHVLSDFSQVAITTYNYDCRVSDRGLKFCGPYQGGQFWVFVKLSLLFVNHFI